MPPPAASPPRIRKAPAAAGQRKPPDDIAAGPGRTIAIGLDHRGPGISAWSGNDGK
jgi:hypothetical protein